LQLNCRSHVQINVDISQGMAKYLCRCHAMLAVEAVSYQIEVRLGHVRWVTHCTRQIPFPLILPPLSSVSTASHMRNAWHSRNTAGCFITLRKSLHVAISLLLLAA
jgi:hypothetical protein